MANNLTPLARKSDPTLIERQDYAQIPRSTGGVMLLRQTPPVTPKTFTGPISFDFSRSADNPVLGVI